MACCMPQWACGCLYLLSLWGLTYQDDPGISTLQHKGHFTHQTHLESAHRQAFHDFLSSMDGLKLAKALAPCNLPTGRTPAAPAHRKHPPSLRPIQVPRATSIAQAEATQDPQSPQRSATGDVQGSQPPTHHGPQPSTTRLLNNVVAFPRRRAIKEPATIIKDDASPFGIISTGKLKVEDLLTGEKPGEADNRRFQLHPSVAFWQNWATEGDDQTEKLQQALRLVGSALSKGGQLPTAHSLAYWAYHFGRSAFFMTQGIAGLAATQMAATAQGSSDMADQVKLGRMFKAGALLPIVEAIVTYQQDFTNIQAGAYKLPYDMTATTLANKQYNPLHVLRSGATFIQEAANTLQRRFANKPEEVWLQSAMYPTYYMNTFHYQTDGWFSQHSANIYETSTETLFVGRQDAMQRQALVPLSGFMRERAANGRATSMLEVACGTGRLATFVKDNWPELTYTASDLSPYYLHEARDNMSRWRQMRQPKLSMGGWHGSGTRFLQAAAENLPERDESHDVVLCMYLFHELPETARRNAVFEFARVLKPGGMMVLGDSCQLGDRPSQDKTMGTFGDFNEPFYRNYIATDLGALFEEAGLVCDQKVLGSSTKVLSFRKPL